MSAVVSPGIRAPLSITGFRRTALTALSVLAFAFVAFASGLAGAQDAAEGRRDDGLIRLDQMDGGGLLLFTDEPGLYVQAPLLSTSIDVSVAGSLARTVVTQRFTNPADVFVEGKYVFPLPEGSAVDTLKMRVGDRLIEGEIKEREEAKEIYETAKAEGYVASLVEQERPNMFTTSVANIGPQKTVVIQIEYQQTLAPRDGVYGLRVPLVSAPRYSPEPRPGLVRFGPKGWELDSNDPVPDRNRITPPVADPRADDPSSIRNPVDLRVDLVAGFPLGPIKSFYHEVNVTSGGAGAATVSFKGPAPADRDFYLSWAPARIAEPTVALFSESREDDEHLLFMITPPAADAIGDTRKPREVIFVQDISGSMYGESIEQARKGLEMAVRRLAPEDTFNIIVFNDRFGMFSDAPLKATPENIRKAVTAVQALEADGGTEMLPALEAALKDEAADESRIRQVIFLTDGAVGNEREMLKLIEEKLGRSRLFTVGIGSAPNSYFMTAAAEAGRGTHVFIGDLAEVQDRMEGLFRRIETPAMTDLTLEVVGYRGAEIWPNPLPDLYAGDPVTAAIRVEKSKATRAIPALVLTGKRDGQLWKREITMSKGEARPGVSKLWARQRIRSLEALRLSPDVSVEGMEQIDREILKTAIEHHLVSRLTSLVAVDVTPTRDPQSQELVSKNVPLNLPKGWDADQFFETEEAAPAPKPAMLQKTAFVRLEAAAAKRAEAAEAGAPPPEAALGWALQALIGLLLLAVGGVILLIGRWRRVAQPAAQRVSKD